MVIVLLIKDNIPSVHVCDPIVLSLSAAVHRSDTHSMYFGDPEVSLHYLDYYLDPD